MPANLFLTDGVIVAIHLVGDGRVELPSSVYQTLIIAVIRIANRNQDSVSAGYRFSFELGGFEPPDFSFLVNCVIRFRIAVTSLSNCLKFYQEKFQSFLSQKMQSNS